MFGFRGLTVLLPLLYLVYYINTTCPLSDPVATSDSLVCQLTHQSYEYVTPFVERVQHTEHYQLVRKNISPYTQALDAQYQHYLSPTVDNVSEKAIYYFKIVSIHAKSYFRFAALKSVELKKKGDIYANDVFIPRAITLYHQSYNYTRTTIIPKTKELFNKSSDYLHEEVLPVVYKWYAITWWKTKDIYQYDVKPRLIVVAHLLKLDLAWNKLQEVAETEYYQTVERPIVLVWKYVSTLICKLHVLLSSFQREELLTSFNHQVESKKEFLRSQFNEFFNASFQLKDLKELGRRNFFDSVTVSGVPTAEKLTDSEETDETEVYEIETETETETEIETETETVYDTYADTSNRESSPPNEEDDDEDEIEYVDIEDVDIDDDDVEIITQRQTVTLFTTVEDPEPTSENETVSLELQPLEEFKEFVTNISSKAQQQFDDSVKELEDEVIAKLNNKLKPLLQELSHTINSDYEKTHLLIADINRIKDTSNNEDTGVRSYKYVTRQDVRDELERLSANVEKQTDAAKAVISNYKSLLEDDIVKIRDRVVTILEEYFDISYTEYSKKIITETSRNSDKAWDEWSEFVALKDRILDVRDDIFTKKPKLENFLKAMSEWDHTLYVLANESGQYLSLLRAKANVQFQIREAEERRQEELNLKAQDEDDNEDINVDDVQLNDETLGHEIEDDDEEGEEDEEVEEDEEELEEDEEELEEEAEEEAEEESEEEIVGEVSNENTKDSALDEEEETYLESNDDEEEEEDTDDEEDYRDEEAADDDEDDQ